MDDVDVIPGIHSDADRGSQYPLVGQGLRPEWIYQHLRRHAFIAGRDDLLVQMVLAQLKQSEKYGS